MLERHPFEFWERFHRSLKAIRMGTPNPSHLAIGKLHQILKFNTQIVQIVTQNIDGYHKLGVP